MIFEELPIIITKTVFKGNVDEIQLEQFQKTAEDAHYLRQELKNRALVAFIADDSILPRESGSSDKPLARQNAIPFKSPQSLRQIFHLPYSGEIKGLGIPEGVTLIVGGGYHGKSTLLKAIESGVYNHIPGDGRELCVSLDDTVKIRSYSGRYICNTNISPFIDNLPFKKDTQHFTTENASGSTSQAAAIIEAIEVGAKVLLMDEDTCATNFMIRDFKMQQLVNKKEEPITTYIDRVRQLYSEKGVSTILVLGGAGDYFDVADHIIQMNKYIPCDVTEEAIDIANRTPVRRDDESQDMPFIITERIPVADSINPFNQYGKKGIYSTDTYQLNFGKYKIDLTDLEQLTEISQTKAIGFAIDFAKRFIDDTHSLRDVAERIIGEIERQGLDILSERISPNFALFRKYELVFALNRLRSLEVFQKRS
jgi:predicted ABC-class ATPase